MYTCTEGVISSPQWWIQLLWFPAGKFHRGNCPFTDKNPICTTCRFKGVGHSKNRVFFPSPTKSSEWVELLTIALASEVDAIPMKKKWKARHQKLHFERILKARPHIRDVIPSELTQSPNAKVLFFCSKFSCELKNSARAGKGTKQNRERGVTFLNLPKKNKKLPKKWFEQLRQDESYEATHWKLNCADHSSLSSTTAVHIWIISYKLHIVSLLTGRYELN